MPRENTGASISVFNNAASIDPMAGRRVIDFEDQPVDGSIANPLVLEGASFTDPVDLRTGFCSSPTCQPDPDNALGGNTSLFLNPAGTIDFPARTIIAALTIEGIGANPFQLKVTDSAEQHEERGWSGSGVRRRHRRVQVFERHLARRDPECGRDRRSPGDLGGVVRA